MAMNRSHNSSGGSGSGSQRQQFLETMAAGIREMCADGSMSDIDIIVEGKTFPCHRIILATFSPYFKAMFHSGMVETREKTLELPDISRKVFELFRDFIYHGDCEISLDNAYELMQAAALFQVLPLQEKCESVLASEMDVENCLQLFKIARSCNCQILIEKCRPFVLEGFNGLWKSDEFSTLDLEDIESIVRDDDLVPVDEEQICEALLHWVTANLQDRKKHLGRLFRHVRLAKISPEYLIEQLYSNELLMADEDCKRYLDEVRDYHLLPARQQDFSTSRFKLRNSDDFSEVLLVLTEYDMERSSSFNQDGKCLWAYNYHQERWYTLATVPFQQNPGIEFAVVAFRNDLYLSGGNMFNKNMLRYDSERNEWNPVEGNMKRGRCNHMMAAVRESIYVLGGQNQKNDVQGSIEEYSINGRRWRTMGELNEPIKEACTAVLGEKIFIFGGKDHKNGYIDSIQMFDTRNREAKEIGTLQGNMKQPLKCLSMNGIILLFTANGDCYQFKYYQDKGFKLKHLKKLPTECQPVIGVSHYRGHVILLSATKDKPLMFSKLFKLDITQSPMRVDQIVGPEQYKTKPKPIHACIHGIISKQFMYHTYFQ